MKEDKLKINFNAGPAALPFSVMEEASKAVMNYNDTGLSILSISHRSKLFIDIIEESKAIVKELCNISDEYEVMWLHGGGRLQFCMIPMNFLSEQETAGYIDSGFWSADAVKYAKFYGNVNVLASSANDNYTHLPEWPATIPGTLSYVHFTSNNTIYGTQWQHVPVCNVPLIADMSSDIFSRNMAYNNCDMFYAVAQKNMGAAGATLVVVKKEMLQNIKRVLPPMLSYAEHAKSNSILNTSPVFSIYTSLLMLRYTKQKGIELIEKENRQKASLLYNEIERNSLFSTSIKAEHRSMMNVCFTATNPAQEKAFITYCEDNNITGIEGHRLVGAFRVSLYNGISVQDVEYLVSVMQSFEKNHKS